MGIEEFSNEFDTLVNSYARFRDFDDKEPRDTIEFDEYEKSLFLTEIQEEVVLGLYKGTLQGEAFEETEELRRYLSSLVQEALIAPSSATLTGVDSNSVFFDLPSNLMFIVYEAVNIDNDACGNTALIETVPVTHDEYHRIKKNPFRGVTNKRALRLDIEGNAEIVTSYEPSNVTGYYIRYIKKPYPILLEDFTNTGTPIHGIYVPLSESAPCELPEYIQHKIIEMAVEKALRTKGININNVNK